MDARTDELRYYRPLVGKVDIAECVPCSACHSLFSYEWVACPNCGHVMGEDIPVEVHRVEEGCITVWDEECIASDVWDR